MRVLFWRNRLCGDGDGLEGLECPPFSIVFGDGGSVACAGFSCDEGLVVGSAGGDPLFEEFDGCAGKLGFFVGHCGIHLVPNQLQHQAVFFVERDDGGAFGAAFEEGFAGGDVEIGFGFAAAVAIETVLFEGGRNFFSEEAEPFFHTRGVVGRKFCSMQGEAEGCCEERQCTRGGAHGVRGGS